MKPNALASVLCNEAEHLATSDRLPEYQVVRQLNTILESLKYAKEEPQRIAIVVDRNLEPRAIANAVAIVSGGLQCEGFESPVPDANGSLHAAIRWSLVVLQAYSGQQLQKLLSAAKSQPVKAVALALFAQELSDNFTVYKDVITSRQTEELDIIAVGLFGHDADVRELTRSFCLFN